MFKIEGKWEERVGNSREGRKVEKEGREAKRREGESGRGREKQKREIG